MYRHQRVSDPEREPDIRCELVTDEPDPETVLGWPGDYYARDGDRFVVGDRNSYLTTDEDWEEITVTPDWEPYHLAYVLEFEVRRRMAGDGRALIHACGLQFEGQTLLCPAWRGAGKTNTLLSILREGGSYLSDDRLWVDADGDVRGYRIPINPHTEQFRSFPDIAPDDMSVLDRCQPILEEKLDASRSLPDKVGLFLASRYLEDDGRTFRDLEELLPGTEYVPESTADGVVLLRAAPNQTSPSIEETSGRSIARALEMIHSYEWNARLEEYFLAFDSLFPEGEKAAQLDQVRTTEQEVFEALLDSVPTYVMRIPRERNWRTSGIDAEVVSLFRSLATPGAAVDRGPRRPGSVSGLVSRARALILDN